MAQLHQREAASGDDPERALRACPLASARLRTAVAAGAWKERGNQNVFWVPGTAGYDRGADWATVDVCVVTKLLYSVASDPGLAACRVATENRCRLVIDITDYPFRRETSPARTFHTEALKICDAVVVNSQRMAEMMASHTPQRLLVIEDAILETARTPGYAPARKLELLWFGHASNLPYLDECLESLVRFGMRRPCRLTVVTAEGVGADQWTRNIDAHFAPAFEARFVPWSLEAMRVALRKCDLVLLPCDPSRPLKAGASANRIAEALVAGRFPVANPLPSYLPFAQAAWLGPDLVEGIEWALAHPGEVLARIRHGQALVAENLAADRIGRQWCEFLQALAGTRNPAA